MGETTNPELQAIQEIQERKQKKWETYTNLLKQSDIENSDVPFVRDLKNIKLSDKEKARFLQINLRINLQTDSGIFGYLSSSTDYDREKELKSATFVARCFTQKEDACVKPVVVPIDNFFQFIPEETSLVIKTESFRRMNHIKDPNQDYALILTGFTDSTIFTEDVVKQVPTQENAGLKFLQETDFGKKLYSFAKGLKLKKIIENNNGDLKKTLEYLTDNGQFSKEDAQLLLVTSLLLADAQNWQNLIFKQERQIHTALYIVAPQPFHNAMIRLNLNWGNGEDEYSYRAIGSLGATLLENDKQKNQMGRHLKGGLSAEEFERKIAPILNRFLETA